MRGQLQSLSAHELSAPAARARRYGARKWPTLWPIPVSERSKVSVSWRLSPLTVGSAIAPRQTYVDGGVPTQQVCGVRQVDDEEGLTRKPLRRIAPDLAQDDRLRGCLGLRSLARAGTPDGRATSTSSRRSRRTSTRNFIAAPSAARSRSAPSYRYDECLNAKPNY
jgi:hypothetical protein